jgi:hypothetical protein
MWQVALNADRHNCFEWATGCQYLNVYNEDVTRIAFPLGILLCGLLARRCDGRDKTCSITHFALCVGLKVGGPPHSSCQEFLCSSGNKPKRIGKEKHKKTTVDLTNFDDASFFPASSPIFPLPILEYCQPAKQIADRHRM